MERKSEARNGTPKNFEVWWSAAYFDDLSGQPLIPKQMGIILSMDDLIHGTSQAGNRRREDLPVVSSPWRRFILQRSLMVLSVSRPFAMVRHSVIMGWCRHAGNHCVYYRILRQRERRRSCFSFIVRITHDRAARGGFSHRHRLHFPSDYPIHGTYRHLLPFQKAKNLRLLEYLCETPDAHDAVLIHKVDMSSR